MLATLPAIALIVMGSSVSAASAFGGMSQGASTELTSDQESALEEARELRKNGEGKEAHEVLKRAGLLHGKGWFVRGGKGNDKESSHHSYHAIQAALDAKDYTAFKNSVVGLPFASLVTEDSFERLVKAHELRKNGDLKGAQQIVKDLGFPQKSFTPGSRHIHR